MWNDIHPQLRILYNKVARAHCEHISENSAQKAEEEAWEIMKELTLLLNTKREDEE